MVIAFVISEEKVFAVRGIKVFPVLHGFFDGWCWRMLVIFEWNFEVGEELV